MPSRIVYVASWGFCAVVIPVSRWAVRTLLIRLRRWGCPVAIYGRPEHAARLITALQQTPELGYIPSVVFTEGQAPVCDLPVGGGFQQAPQNLSVAAISMPSFSPPEMKKLIDHTLFGVNKVILFPDVHEGVFMSVRPRNFGSLIGLEVASNLLNPLARLLKRTFDLTVVLATAPCWIGVCAVLAPLIWLTNRASPFYIQTRMGKNGKAFGMIKFRTMVPDAEQCLAAALDSDPALRAEWTRHFKLKDDPRITPAGRFLRRFSLDELPQLFNVLCGQMSLVGPRPLPEYHYEALSDNTRMPRSRVRPGLTGLWQIMGRSDNDLAEMEEWDTYYVRNWSLWLDAVILARTWTSALNSRGAY